nr:PREDICTED: F-box/LRR-repeat protein 7 [Bemisia tabaci]
MAHVSTQGHLSPMVCPLAKLGRSAPTYDQKYNGRNVYHAGDKLDLPMQHSPSSPPSFVNRSISIGNYTESTNHSLLHYDTQTNFERSSPCLDQGYHTLISFASQCWQDTPFKGKRAQSKSNAFDRLPDEVVLKIFAWLSSSDLSVCARVCKRWEILAWEPSLWRTVILKGEDVSGDRAVKTILRRFTQPYVQRLYLRDGARITDKGLPSLVRRWPNLTHVQLQGCVAITDSSVSELVAKCPNLQHLDLTGCAQLTCINIEPSRRLSLNYLDLTDCCLIEDESLWLIVKNCPQLVYLYLRRCVKITDCGIKHVPIFCSVLRELSVSDCNKVTDLGLYELAKLGSTLRYLSVAKCDQVSDVGLKVVARRCYRLRYLNVRGCEAVSDDAITVLARWCPRLRALDLGKCDVSDAGLHALAECCPNLKKLSLRSCDLITDIGVQYIAFFCRGLQQLNIQDCQITVEGYRAVKKYCKRCIIEHTNPGFF